MKTQDTYIDFIRYAVHREKEFPIVCEQIEWADFLQFCNRQGVIGLVFSGLERSGMRIPQQVLFEWISYAESIKQQNLVVDKRVCQITKFFSDHGYRSVVLKGQVNGLMYPVPEQRSPGDIDIWVEGEREDIIKEVLKVCPDAHYSFHHIKMPVFKDVSVEVHYRPIYMANWFTDMNLHSYISSVEGKQFSNKVSFDGGEICCLTDDFNVVYQILHMYHHFFETRNNFKQFVDYYYLLKRYNAKNNDIFNKEVAENLRKFGVLKYAKGIMWVMKETLGLEDKYLIVEPSEKEGRLILKESGYFGMWSTNKMRSVIEQFVANFRIVTHYPKEVLIGPLFLIWHQWWKVKMWWRLK